MSAHKYDMLKGSDRRNQHRNMRSNVGKPHVWHWVLCPAIFLARTGIAFTGSCALGVSCTLLAWGFVTGSGTKGYSKAEALSDLQ